MDGLGWAEDEVEHLITPVIYMLPKIHEDNERPPGRPIIAGIGSLTEMISTFIDSLLKTDSPFICQRFYGHD